MKQSLLLIQVKPIQLDIWVSEIGDVIAHTLYLIERLATILGKLGTKR
jgi:hypothetical protein